MKRNTSDRPSEYEIRVSGAVPFASQIPNDSDVDGLTIADMVNALVLGVESRKAILGLAIDTLNDEKSVALGGLATDLWCPTRAIVKMAAVDGAAATGDVEITIGIVSGGTEIAAATVCTNLINLNDTFMIDLSGVVKEEILANSTVFVKVTTADTTAGAGHLADVYLYGETIPAA